MVVVKKWKGISPSATMKRSREQQNCHRAAHTVLATLQDVKEFEKGLVECIKLYYQYPKTKDHMKVTDQRWSRPIHKKFKRVQFLPMDYFTITTANSSAYSEAWTLEPFIDGNFEKFSNNGTYVKYSEKDSPHVDSESEVAQIFSHMSILFANGTFFKENAMIHGQHQTDTIRLVVDIQGVGLTWTDPAVHCVNNYTYGNTNLEKEGINMWMRKHVALRTNNGEVLLCCQLHDLEKDEILRQL